MTSPEIAYICNRERCPDCSWPRCTLTTNIRFAKNFMEVGQGHYIEKGIDMTDQIQNTEETAVNTIETKEITVEQENTAQDIRRQEAFARRRKQQFYTLIKTIFNICNISGFRVEGHIRIKDLKTGKVYE